ncbi:MAG: methylmalonyl-CoA mutase [Bacteroidetes bacterium]|jgi:methylmalonyl-CoA mutase|nr:methylmalonyl-CoA mutase [Bacteroidota bacterium]
MEKLFEGFSPVSALEWKTRIEKDLKEIPYTSLLKEDRNGILIKPFYNPEDLVQQPDPVFNSPGWEICSAFEVKDEKESNKQAFFALQNGASGLCFIINTRYDLDLLLHDISIPHIYLQFDVKENQAAFLVAFQNYVHGKGLEPGDLNCCINYDSIGNYIRSGSWSTSAKAEELSFLLTSKVTHSLFAACVDGRMYQNSGSSPATELALALAHLNEYLHRMENNKTLATAKKIYVSLATGTEFFEEIAKLRAFRKVAALLFESYGIQPALHLHSETSDTYRSTVDSYTNLLRDSISGMAAVLGGCNTLVIKSFNGKEATEFSTRMGRNQQLIFKEEAYLDKVADVAAGSFFIESLTEEIAGKAWEEFKQIEKQGGLIASFEKGSVQKMIAEQAEKLVAEYKSGKRVLIGVNKYPNPTDAPKPIPAKEKSANGLKQLVLTNELLKA